MSLIEKIDNKWAINIGLYFVVPFLQRYMRVYDISSDSFVTGMHVYTIRIGSRRTEKWYQKFFTAEWVPVYKIWGA